MSIRTSLLAAIFVVASTALGLAQSYGGATPAPRTTDVTQLRALATDREIHERFAFGIDDETRGAWSAAAAEFERIVALHPSQPRYSTAQYDLGIAYAHLTRNADAAGEFRAALTGDPGFLAAMANLIAVDIARGDLHEARTIADRFIANAPDSARALYSRGIVALAQGDTATAQSDFGTLLHLDPQYAVAHYDLGLAQARSGDYAGAEREFGTALDLAPSYARARFALGTILLREGKRAQARAAFDAVVRDAGGDPALANLAVAMRDAIH